MPSTFINRSKVLPWEDLINDQAREVENVNKRFTMHITNGSNFVLKAMSCMYINSFWILKHKYCMFSESWLSKTTSVIDHNWFPGLYSTLDCSTESIL